MSHYCVPRRRCRRCWRHCAVARRKDRVRTHTRYEHACCCCHFFLASVYFVFVIASLSHAERTRTHMRYERTRLLRLVTCVFKKYIFAFVCILVARRKDPMHERSQGTNTFVTLVTFVLRFFSFFFGVCILVWSLRKDHARTHMNTLVILVTFTHLFWMHAHQLPHSVG
jgi:hypothetical protein